MRVADASTVAALCTEVEDACDADEYPLSCCILYKLRDVDDLFLTAVTDGGTPDFVKALVAYFQDFGGRQLQEYEVKILERANMNRTSLNSLVLQVHPERYEIAKKTCEALYTTQGEALDFILILLECAPEYKTVLGEENYVQYLFRETASVCPREPYPMISSVVQLIKKRLA